MTQQTRIEKLTPEQEKDLIATREKWLAIGRSTARINKREVKKIIRDMYAAIKKSEPEVLFFPSPISCLEEYKRRNPNESVKSQLGNYFAGAYWCGWEVFFDFCRRIGVKYTDEQNRILDLWMRQSEHCHLWWPYEGITLVSDRPVELHLDDRGRLHNELGPALAYSDGFGLYAIHGVILDEKIIESPEKIPINELKSETNAEIRRIMIERRAGKGQTSDRGWRIYLKEVGAVCVDRRRNDVEQTEEALLKTANESLLLCHCPSTGRIYTLEVPTTIKTCVEAQKYLWSGSTIAERFGPGNCIGRS